MIDLDAITCLADIPRVQAARYGNVPAIRFEGRDTGFADLDRQSDAVAAGLLSSGVGAGTRVGILARNHDRWYPLLFGSMRVRACLAPINARLAAPEIEYIIADAEPGLLFVGADLFETALAATTDLADPPRLIALHGAHPAFEDFDQWLGSGHSAPDLPAPQPDDDVIQLYTSGTTGRPKGVVLTNRNYRRWLEMAASIEGFAYDPGDTAMVIMPLFHVAGANMGVAALAQGARIVLVRDFVAADIVATLTDERVAHTFLAPAMIQMLLQSPALESADFSALRTIAYGASPIAEDVLLRAQSAFGCGFVQFYGMTESTGGGTYLPPSAHGRPGLAKSCGIAWPDTEVAILGPDGKALAPGAIGEIAIRGDLVMRGYWRREEATRDTVVDGWLRTGDAGFMDADGYVFVHDRIKDLIVSGGENVYPAEVENAIQGCPGVLDVAVIGVPDAIWGEAVKALVVAADPPPDAAAIIAWTRARIAPFKAPKSVDFVDALPRNPSGKVLRRELRAPFWAGRDRAVG